MPLLSSSPANGSLLLGSNRLSQQQLIPARAVAQPEELFVQVSNASRLNPSLEVKRFNLDFGDVLLQENPEINFSLNDPEFSYETVYQYEAATTVEVDSTVIYYDLEGIPKLVESFTLEVLNSSGNVLTVGSKPVLITYELDRSDPSAPQTTRIVSSQGILYDLLFANSSQPVIEDRENETGATFMLIAAIPTT